MGRYGRVEDLVPILLSAVNAKVNTLETERALIVQRQELMDSFEDMHVELEQTVQDEDDGIELF